MSTFRPTYRVLTKEEQRSLDDIKDLASQLEARILIASAPSRHQSLAITKLEESVMWAVKGVTA